MTGVVEQEIAVEARGARVPTLLWRPTSPAPGAPLVLYGHGGTGHMRNPHTVEATHRLVLDQGWSVAAIDGPCHGERRLAAEVADADDTEAMWPSYQGYLQHRGPDAVAAEMTTDWKAALDALLATGEFDDSPLGYYGLSMGSRFGVPFLAEEPRISAAVLGLAGTSAGAYMLPAAAKVTVPLLFVANIDDAIFPFPGNLELFNALGSEDKRMHVFPGGHGEIPADEPATLADFLADRMRGGADI